MNTQEKYKIVKEELNKLGWKFKKVGDKVRIYDNIGWIEWYIDFIYVCTLVNKDNQLNNMIFNRFKEMEDNYDRAIKS